MKEQTNAMFHQRFIFQSNLQKEHKIKLDTVMRKNNKKREGSHEFQISEDQNKLEIEKSTTRTKTDVVTLSKKALNSNSYILII